MAYRLDAATAREQGPRSSRVTFVNAAKVCEIHLHAKLRRARPLVAVFVVYIHGCRSYRSFRTRQRCHQLQLRHLKKRTST